jgi:uncharacterized damage-inducible protein DinB
LTKYQTLTEEALESWEYVRQGVVEEVENLAAADLDFRPTSDNRSTRELVHHIIESSIMWSRELSRPDGDFTRGSFAELVAEAAPYVGGVQGRDELLHLLRSAWTEGDRAIRDAGELHMLQWIRRFDGEQGTRLAWLNHGIDHEMYHRGQLALYARLVGRVPALTQRIG